MEVGMSDGFELPENPDYTLRDSARDSVRFAHRCLEPHDGSRWRAIGTFVDYDARIQGWHDFGHLEGPGWAANAMGGACLLYAWSAFDHCHLLQHVALGLADHVLDDGFIQPDGFVWSYRDTASGERCLNFKHNNDWFCPGSIARIGLQMLWMADMLDPDDARTERLRTSAARTAEWLVQHVDEAEGWYPRRCTPAGRMYGRSAEGGEEPLAAASADGFHIPWLILELHERGIAADLEHARARLDAAMNRGGIYGSVNHDTYDTDENVAHAIAFRTMLRAARVLNEPGYRAFAYESALAGLERFKMCEDRNGVATRGLLYMEDSWDTAYLWENAEIAVAYLEAFEDRREKHFLCWAVTILRAIARHHYGPLGFLTEGVDWNNHVGRQHHIGDAEFGAIKYTEPLLNNLHHIEAVMRSQRLLETCD
jgi:hypothetical protein